MSDKAQDKIMSGDNTSLATLNQSTGHEVFFRDNVSKAAGNKPATSRNRFGQMEKIYTLWTRHESCLFTAAATASKALC